MKKIFLTLLAVASVALMANATDLTGKRIYVNPGHGSFGPNDRPCATIPYPNLPSTGMPDTCGFYESNTDLWKCEYLRDRLREAGAFVMMSREQNGPWPYQKVNGDYPSYSYADYSSRPDYEQFNRSLSEICEEVEANNMDFFISVHSNAATDGGTTNYPLGLYRGQDNGTSAHETASKAAFQAIWPYRWEMFGAGFDQATYYSATNMNVRGDLTFYGDGSTATRSNGKQYTGYLGVLKHGAIGGLYEGYFHTYQPARHRALNHDYCYMEGLGYYRGIVDYFNAGADTKGYILGTVKDLHAKMAHPLFHYAPKTNDQWVPCNGAVVTLYKAGVEIGQYTVDTLYNGIFCFKDLEPGNDYTLDITCEGYKPLFNEYKTPITVTANTTTYPMVFLEAADYEAPTDIPEDYPTPAGHPAYLGLPTSLSFAAPTSAPLAFEGTIKRAIQAGDSTIVLTHSADGTPHLYLVNDSITTISLAGLVAVDPTNESDYLSLSDIAYTADGKLIGCNLIETQYDNSRVGAEIEDGVPRPNSKRGTLRLYKWDSLAGDATVWAETQNSANLYNALSGHTLTVSGASTDCNVTVSASSVYGTGIRWTQMQITDNVIASTLWIERVYLYGNEGENYSLQLSPRGEKTDLVLTGNAALPVEFHVVANGQVTEELGRMVNAADITLSSQTNFFAYGNRKAMVTPYYTAEGLVAGVRLFDITDGFEVAKPITANLDLAAPVAAEYASAQAKVIGRDIKVILTTNTAQYTFSTVGQEQPAVRHIGAYGLNMEEQTDNYKLTYTATDNAIATSIVFFQDGKEVGEVAVAPAVKGANEALVAKADVPGFSATETTWAVRLAGESVADWYTLFSISSDSIGGGNAGAIRNYVAVDNSPESDFFGRTYMMHRNGSRNAANGIVIFDQEMQALNDINTAYNGGRTFGNPQRLSVDQNGKVYCADWGDGDYSSVWTMDPANPTAAFVSFFEGTRNGDGVVSNNGVEISSSTPSVFVYGMGAESKLLVYNEDRGTSLVANGVCAYNIGQADGSVVASWGAAPSAKYPMEHQANTEGNVWGTSHGFFCSQVRGAGNNNASAASLVFYDYNGTKQFVSFEDPYLNEIDGSEGGGYAVSADEKTLILNNASKEFLVYDIAWTGDKPVLTLRYVYKHDMNYIRQMAFDYAGNLVCAGECGLHIFSVPTADNVTTVPAKKALAVTKPYSGHVEAITLSESEVKLLKDETFELTVNLMPLVAEATSTVWTSSNENVATVADGVITAVGKGTATITVTIDGTLTETCKVTVTVPVTGITINKESVELAEGETITLTATVEPSDANNKSFTWASEDKTIATVSTAGKVKAIKAGTTTITATTADGGFVASCTIIVKGTGLDDIYVEKAEKFYLNGQIYIRRGDAVYTLTGVRVE